MRRLFEGGVYKYFCSEMRRLFEGRTILDISAAFNRINTALSQELANLMLRGNPNPNLPSREEEKKS